MPISKIKAPEAYSHLFHAVLKAGRGVRWMGLVAATEEAARRELRRFMYFRKALRANPSHRLAKIELTLSIHAKVLLNPIGPGYDVRVTVRSPTPKRPPRTLPIEPTTRDADILAFVQKTIGADLDGNA